MSVKVMTRVWESNLPRDEKYITLCLADFGNDEGDSIYPSIGYIAYKTGYSETQVKAILRKLRAEGIITVGFAGSPNQSKYGTNLYKINLDRLPERPPYTPPPNGRPEKRGSDSDPHEKGGLDSEKGGSDSVKVGAKTDPYTLEESLVNPLVKNMPAETAGVSDESKLPPIVKNPRAFRALRDFETRHRQGNEPDLGDYPEDCRPWVKKFWELWQIVPPKKSAGKGSQFALWIRETRYLANAAGEFGLVVLDKIFAEHEAERQQKGQAPFMVSRPGSLIKATNAKAGELRRQGYRPATAEVTEIGAPAPYDKNTETLDDYLKRVEQQRQRNEAYMAEVKARQKEMIEQGLYNRSQP